MTMTRPRPSARGKQRLAKNAFEHHGKLRANLRLLVGREDVHDTVDGGNAELVCSVAKVKWPVSAMRSADSMVSRSRISPMSTTSGSSRRRRAQRIREGVRVRVDFALIHQALLVVVEELDGVLDRDHVLFALGVDLVEHRGERRGLARTGRAGDQHQAARLVAQSSSPPRGKPSASKPLISHGIVRNTAPTAPRWLKQIAAETRQILQAEREVQLQIFLEPVLLRVGQHAIGQRLGVRRGQGSHIQRPQLVRARARAARCWW